mgnify:CR=1 FL=1
MIYFRVASQVGQSPDWKWRSTPLTSIQALMGFLKTCGCARKSSVRVFFSSSLENMDEMLSRQNNGLVSGSMTAEQFLTKKSIHSMDIVRLEMELGSGRDHDVPYEYVHPTYTPEVLAWTKLLAKVRNGELEP